MAFSTEKSNKFFLYLYLTSTSGQGKERKSSEKGDYLLLDFPSCQLDILLYAILVYAGG